MAVSDLFSDKNERDAQRLLRKAYGKGNKQAQEELWAGFEGMEDSYSDAIGRLTSSRDGATRAINDGLDDSIGYIDSGLKGSVNDVRGGLDRSLHATWRGRDNALDNIDRGRDRALAEYDPYMKATAGAAGSYADALGLNGDEGYVRATESFRAGPGYDFMMNAGLDALDRRAASRGMLASGNNQIDTINYAGGLADQEYDDHLARLDGQQRLGVGIADARSGIQTNAGAAKAGIHMDSSGRIAGLHTGAATSLAGLRTGAAGARAGLTTDAAGRVSDLREDTGVRTAALTTGLGEARYGLGSRLGDLDYATTLGKAGVRADFLKGLDQGGANVAGTILGGASIGARLLAGL